MYSLISPYAGRKGNTVVKTINNSLKRILADNVKPRVTYTDPKLSTKLQIKDKTKDQHKHDLAYYSKCPETTCNEDYLGKTERELLKDQLIIAKKINNCTYLDMLCIATTKQ